MAIRDLYSRCQGFGGGPWAHPGSEALSDGPGPPAGVCCTVGDTQAPGSHSCCDHWAAQPVVLCSDTEGHSGSKSLSWLVVAPVDGHG